MWCATFSLLPIGLHAVRNAHEVRAPHLAPCGGAACSRDVDCNLNGLCNRGACTCDRGWTGGTCGVLDLQPVPVADEAPYSGAIWPPNREVSSWGGNVVPPRSSGGEFSLYASEMVEHCGLATWQKNSRIVHAKAKTLEGPYSLVEEILGPFSHNANPVLLPGSQDVAVMHVGDGSATHAPKQCSNGTTPEEIDAAEDTGAGKTCTYQQKDYEPIPMKKALRVPHAPQGSAGEWELEPQTCVGPAMDEANIGGCPHFSNAATLTLANGTTLLVHSGCQGWQQSGLNLAVSPDWTGPYRPVHGTHGDDGEGRNAWYTPSIDTTSNPDHALGGTDPYMWMDPRGRFHVLLHLHWVDGDKGGHAFSEDGLTWTTSLDQPFGEVVVLNDGTSIEYMARQRPHLVLNDDGLPGVSPSGSPAALVTGQKAFNKDKRGQLPWMQWCKTPMAPGCDSTFTHLQRVGTAAASNVFV